MYDVRSAQMEFSLTDTQLPMFLRIIKLALALYYGDLDEKDSPSDRNEGKSRDFTVDMSLVEEEIEDDKKQAWIDEKQYKPSCSRVCFGFLIHYFDEFFGF